LGRGSNCLHLIVRKLCCANLLARKARPVNNGVGVIFLAASPPKMPRIYTSPVAARVGGFRTIITKSMRPLANKTMGAVHLVSKIDSSVSSTSKPSALCAGYLMERPIDALGTGVRG
jgi:hypothetical protein